MNAVAVQEALRQDFATRFLADFDRVLLDNKDEQQPESGTWARLTIIPATSEQASTGSPSSNRFRTSGIMLISLFVDYGKGDKSLMTEADKLADPTTGYSNKTIGVVHTRTASVSRMGRSGKWYQVNVSVPWYADKIG